MRCPPPPTDWGVIAMWALAALGLGLSVGKVWGERSAVPPEDPPPD